MSSRQMSSFTRSDSTDSFVNSTAGEKLRDMSIQDPDLPLPAPAKQAPIFARPRKPSPPPPSSFAVPSSDPFTALRSSQIPEVRPRDPARPQIPSAPKVLAVEIPPSSLRPLAFRVFTKKHNLTIKSEALTLLCGFIGKKCGADWKTSGSAEKLLEEVARTWKRNEGTNGVLVDGNDAFKAVLKGIEVPGGAPRKVSLVSRADSFDFASGDTVLGDSQLETQEYSQPKAMLMIGKADKEEEDENVDPQEYLHIVGAFSQPKYNYNATKKQFERSQKPKLLSPPTSKHQIFHTRHNLLHHRLLRNPSFQPPTFTPMNNLTTRGSKTYYKLTPIANLLGRAGLPFLLFGLLSLSPDTGLLTLEDPTGTIQLDTSQAVPVPENGAWFNPGSFAVVDGLYEANGKFTVFTIGQPPCERREATAEIFGHVDFLGVNIPLELSTPRSGRRGLRVVEKRLASENKSRVVILNDVYLDLPRTHDALTRLFMQWEEDTNSLPLVCVMCGKFQSEGFTNSLSYKESFDTLAATLSIFHKLQTQTTFVFVPSDSDPWTTTFTAGAAGTLPRKGIPDLFTTRIKRLFSQANAKTASNNNKGSGKVVFSSNPARIAYFTKEIVVFRDELAGRFNRNSVRFKSTQQQQDDPTREINLTEGNMDIDGMEGATGLPTSTAPAQDEISDEIKLARKLVKTVLDQSHLSPFPLSIRPQLWDYTHTLSLFPLPTYLVLADPTSPPFTVVYEGCCVVNPGRFLWEGNVKKARYAEFVVGGDEGGKCGEFWF